MAIQFDHIRSKVPSPDAEFARGIMIIGVAVKRYLKKIDLVIHTLQEAIQT